MPCLCSGQRERHSLQHPGQGAGSPLHLVCSSSLCAPVTRNCPGGPCNNSRPCSCYSLYPLIFSQRTPTYPSRPSSKIFPLTFPGRVVRLSSVTPEHWCVYMCVLVTARSLYCTEWYPSTWAQTLSPLCLCLIFCHVNPSAHFLIHLSLSSNGSPQPLQLQRRKWTKGDDNNTYKSEYSSCLC